LKQPNNWNNFKKHKKIFFFHNDHMSRNNCSYLNCRVLILWYFRVMHFKRICNNKPHVKDSWDKLSWDQNEKQLCLFGAFSQIWSSYKMFLFVLQFIMFIIDIIEFYLYNILNLTKFLSAICFWEIVQFLHFKWLD